MMVPLVGEDGDGDCDEESPDWVRLISEGAFWESPLPVQYTVFDESFLHTALLEPEQSTLDEPAFLQDILLLELWLVQVIALLSPYLHTWFVELVHTVSVFVPEL